MELWICWLFFFNTLEVFLKGKWKIPRNLTFSEKLILFGLENGQSEPIQFLTSIVLEVKFFIYKCKTKSSIPYISCFPRQLTSCYKIEEFNARMNCECFKFRQDWFCSLHLQMLIITVYCYLTDTPMVHLFVHFRVCFASIMNKNKFPQKILSSYL